MQSPPEPVPRRGSSIGGRIRQRCRADCSQRRLEQARAVAVTHVFRDVMSWAKAAIGPVRRSMRRSSPLTIGDPHKISLDGSICRPPQFVQGPRRQSRRLWTTALRQSGAGNGRRASRNRRLPDGRSATPSTRRTSSIALAAHRTSAEATCSMDSDRVPRGMQLAERSRSRLGSDAAAERSRLTNRGSPRTPHSGAGRHRVDYVAAGPCNVIVR